MTPITNVDVSSNRSGGFSEPLITRGTSVGDGIDLSDEAVGAYLKRLGPIAEVIVEQMEQAEGWPSDDDPKVQAALAELAACLDEDTLSRLAKHPPVDLATVLGYFRVGRNLQLLAMMEEATRGEQGPGEVLLGLARATRGRPEATAVLVCAARFQHFERVQCLEKVYGSGRAQRILEAIRHLQG